MVRLSAPILTRPQTPAFTGRIEVDINAEDLPGGTAQFGKCYISLRCASITITYVCLVSYCPFCIVLLSLIMDKIEIQNGSNFCA